MATMNSAKIYYDEAQKRAKAGNIPDAIDFYIKAAQEYGALKNQFSSNSKANGTTLQIIQNNYEDCLKKVKQYTTPPEEKQQRATVGGTKEGAKSNFNVTVPNTTFDDIAGMSYLKGELEKAIIWPLKYADKFSKYFDNKIKTFGIFLYGPPGCGKTFVTKAAAGQASKEGTKVSFIKIGASDVLDSWVGNSEKNIVAAFDFAAKNEPAILFFDELDGIGKYRRGSSTYSDRFVNEFLQAFERIEGKRVVVIAATNHPWLVDPALIRSGRIGKKIYVSPPDLEARIEIFKTHCKGKPMSEDVGYDELGKLTENYVASDIEAIVDEATLCAISREVETKEKNNKIRSEDFAKAIVKIKPSLYSWCRNAAQQLRRNDNLVEKEFKDISALIKKVSSGWDPTSCPEIPNEDGGEG